MGVMDIRTGRILPFADPKDPIQLGYRRLPLDGRTLYSGVVIVPLPYYTGLGVFISFDGSDG